MYANGMCPWCSTPHHQSWFESKRYCRLMYAPLTIKAGLMYANGMRSWCSTPHHQSWFESKLYCRLLYDPLTIKAGLMYANGMCSWCSTPHHPLEPSPSLCTQMCMHWAWCCGRC